MDMTNMTREERLAGVDRCVPMVIVRAAHTLVAAGLSAYLAATQVSLAGKAGAIAAGIIAVGSFGSMVCYMYRAYEYTNIATD